MFFNDQSSIKQELKLKERVENSPHPHPLSTYIPLKSKKTSINWGGKTFSQNDSVSDTELTVIVCWILKAFHNSWILQFLF